MNLRKAFDDGKKAAWARFKLANTARGAAGYNPTLNAGATGGMPAMQSAGAAMGSTMPKPAVSPTAPAAMGASKANVLG